MNQTRMHFQNGSTGTEPDQVGASSPTASAASDLTASADPAVSACLDSPAGSSSASVKPSTPTKKLFERDTFVVRGFAGTTDALESARVCRDAGIDCHLVPRPASMGEAECGTALRTRPADELRVADLLAQAGVVPSARIEVLDYV